MEWAVGFVLGVVADIFRSVLLPASTQWINRLIPAAHKKANVEENILTLSIMEKLQSLGKDPSLAKYARDDNAHFLKVLTNQQEVFVEHAIEIIDSTHMTQLEMNMEATRRAEVAGQQMERAIIALERSGRLNDEQISALEDAQMHWEKYARAHAKFATAEFHGGSMASLVQASELEAVTVIRTGELRRILAETRQRYED